MLLLSVCCSNYDVGCIDYELCVSAGVSMSEVYMLKVVGEITPPCGMSVFHHVDVVILKVVSYI